MHRSKKSCGMTTAKSTK